MTMLIKVSIDCVNQLPMIIDLDEPSDLEKLKGMDWYSYLIHLEEGEVIEFKCLERDDRWA